MSSVTRAIYSKVKLGKEIQKSHPQVAQDFLAGETHDQIIEKYNLEHLYGGTIGYLRGGIHYAIYGSNMANGDNYPGLVNRELLQERNHRLRQSQGKHMQGFVTPEMSRENGHNGGKRAYEEVTGVFALSKEEQYQNSSKGGTKAKELGVGIHSEENRNNPKRKNTAAKNSLTSRGLTPWEPGEEGLLYILEPLNLTSQEITSYINNIYHEGKNVRSERAISSRLSKVRKKGSLDEIL